MIYEQSLITRWHDTDATLAVRPSLMLVYMQEMAFAHLDSVGKNLDTMRDEQGLAFILTRLSLRFTRPVRPLQTVVAQTWVSEGHGVNFPRYFCIRDTAGEVVAQGVSSWVLIDLNTHLPVRASSFDYGFSYEQPLDLVTPRRLVAPEGMVEVGTRRIVYSDIDYNGHMNNTRYPDMVCDFLPEGTVPRIHTMHLEFAKEAKFGATLRVERGSRVAETGEQVYLVRTIDEAGEVCLAAEVWLDGDGGAQA